MLLVQGRPLSRSSNSCNQLIHGHSRGFRALECRHVELQSSVAASSLHLIYMFTAQNWRHLQGEVRDWLCRHDCRALCQETYNAAAASAPSRAQAAHSSVDVLANGCINYFSCQTPPVGIEAMHAPPPWNYSLFNWLTMSIHWW